MKSLLGFWILILSCLAPAHGENELGPHKGYIRMPGAFHTEVVPLSPFRLKIFLLDMRWKNPMTKNSSVLVSYKSTKAIEKNNEKPTQKTTEKSHEKVTASKCQTKETHFICSFPKTVDLNQPGELLIEAQRDNQKGNLVSYELPLKLEAPAMKMDHGSH